MAGGRICACGGVSLHPELHWLKPEDSVTRGLVSLLRLQGPPPSSYRQELYIFFFKKVYLRLYLLLCVRASVCVCVR